MTETKQELNVAETETTKANTPVVANTEIEAEIVEDPALTEKANQIKEELLNADKKNISAHKYITSIGKEEIAELQSLSRALDAPIKNMADLDSDSNVVSNNLIDLKVQVEDIDPGKVDFEPGFIGRILHMITGYSPVNKYFTKFQSTRSVIDSIVRSLQEGKRTLEEDNIIFEEDKKRYRETTKKLQEKIMILRELDRLIEEEIQTTTDEDRKKFLQEEVSFSIKQHLIDLEQTLAVTGQGVIAIDMLIKNNRELIRGVDRAINVTVSALTIGATIMVGLSNQKKVLEKTKAVNDATNNIILSTSEMLKNQGAEIQKQAASSTMDIDKLRQAVRNAIDAVEDVENFKRKALPEMSNAINELHSLNETVETKIQKMEKAEQQKLSV